VECYQNVIKREGETPQTLAVTGFAAFEKSFPLQSTKHILNHFVLEI